MRRTLALILALCALLSGCASTPAETETAAPTAQATTEPTTEPTEEPTTVPTTEPEPVYTNPLTGEVIDEPLDTRIFAVSINNIYNAVPHCGVVDADIFMEMFVNGSIVRGLALFTDPSSVPSIGSVRSTRYMFTNIAAHYDAIVAHAGGSYYVLSDASTRGVDGFNIDTGTSTYYSFRDGERSKSGIPWEACLMAKGEGLVEKALESGIDISQDPEKDYKLIFTEDGTPADGESAQSITVTFKSYGMKDTTMAYDAEAEAYAYWQHNKQMFDGTTGAPETFKNVIIMLADIKINQYGYHEADFLQGGTGYYACGGKIIPIIWGCDADDQPFWFQTEDGQPLSLGVGNSYIAVAPLESIVVYE